MGPFTGAWYVFVKNDLHTIVKTISISDTTGSSPFKKPTWRVESEVVKKLTVISVCVLLTKNKISFVNGIKCENYIHF